MRDEPDLSHGMMFALGLISGLLLSFFLFMVLLFSVGKTGPGNMPSKEQAHGQG